MPLHAVHVPEDHRIGPELKILQPQGFHPLHHLGFIAPRFDQPRQVALDVRHEDRHPDPAESLRQHPQGHGLARPRGPGNESVPVGHLRQQADLMLTFGNY